MAVRSTNANRFATTQGGRSRGDRVDFGPPRNPGYDAWQSEQDQWGMSPWYSAGAQMPWSGPPGQQRGQRAPIYTPDAGDPRNAGYWRNQSTPEEIAADNAAAQQRYGQARDLLASNPAYAQAAAAGDMRGQIAAMMALRQQMQQQRFVDQGGTAQTWQDRYRNEDNWMRPGVGGAVPAPAPRGMPPAGVGPTGAPPATTMARPDMMAVMQRLGGAGVMQGPGGYGQYSPGVSKSGMGQSPNAGPAMATTGYNPNAGGGLSPDIQRKLAMGMPRHLLGL